MKQQETKKAGRPQGARQITRADEMQIAALRAAGFTPDQIAATMRRGRATIYNHIKAMTVQPPLPFGADQ